MDRFPIHMIDMIEYITDMLKIDYTMPNESDNAWHA